MRRAARALAVAAGVLVMLGVVVVATAPPTSFGWFAYAPLPLALSGRQLLGLAIVVVGLVLAGVALGLRLGRHRRS